MSDFEKANAVATFTSGVEPEVRRDGSFRFFAPFDVFEKADAPEGKRRRIAGIISTDCRDKQRERILQDGLDFKPFLESGFINDNHMKGIAGIIGEPDPAALRRFKKGERLPNGEVARSNGHWAEAWLYEGDPRADEIWTKAQAMRKSGSTRRLGFSIEGGVIKSGPAIDADGKDIYKAVVRHVAATHCPVNPETTLDVLAKSLGEKFDELVEQARKDDLEAALGDAARDVEQSNIDGTKDLDLGDRKIVDTTRYDFAAKAVTSTSPTGAALRPESLEGVTRRRGAPAMNKSMTVEQAFARVRERFPNIKCAAAGRVVDLALARSRGGKHG